MFDKSDVLENYLNFLRPLQCGGYASVLGAREEGAQEVAAGKAHWAAHPARRGSPLERPAARRCAAPRDDKNMSS